jgi:hypothetical protein
MNLDKQFALIINDYGPHGIAFVETGLADATFEQAANDICSGQYSNPRAVIEFNPVEGQARDVSEFVAHEIATRAVAAGEPPCHEARLYCERYGYEFRDRVQEAAE